MRNTILSTEDFKIKILSWANQFDAFVLLDNNKFSDTVTTGELGEFELVLAAGIESEIKQTNTPFLSLNEFTQNQLAFGYLSYDLKNYTENLSSNNFDGLNFPSIHFFIPRIVLVLDKKGKLHLLKSDKKMKAIVEEINATKLRHAPNHPVKIKKRMEKAEYLNAIRCVKEHIMRGDIYEMNYCQEFYAESTELDPITAYIDLAKISPTPFACFYKIHDKYLISASPERFIKKSGQKIISQPIKGTIKRGSSPEEDEMLKAELRNNKKEQAENVMIVDLVRNDLSKTAKDGTVTVPELFGIYPFNQVFQMISTVESEMDERFTAIDVIENAFPMGSMTGAPKISAMNLIEHYEKTKRGLYSGAVGYTTPSGDFDFNVIIRSMLYNASSKYLSFSVGSAITYGSDAEKEYEECLIKAKAIMEVLEQKNITKNK